MKHIFHIARSFREAEEWDNQQHREMPVVERLDAVEFLREQCCVAAGAHEVPRIQKTGRIVAAGRERAERKAS